MKLLVIVPPGASEAQVDRLAAIRRQWISGAHDESVHRLDGPLEYGEFLDVVLTEQADVVLLVAMAGNDALVRAVTDMVWKFDSATRVVLDGSATAVGGVLAVNGPVEAVLTVLAGHTGPTTTTAPATTTAPTVGTETDGPDGPAAGASTATMVPATTRPMLVSRSWSRDPHRYLSATDAAELAAVIDGPADGIVTLTGPDGYRHLVGTPLATPGLLRLLDDRRLGALVESAMGSPEVWLGALEGLVPGGAGWHRELVAPRAETGGAFRPGLSVLVAVDADGGRVAVRPGSHRLLDRAAGTSQPVADVRVGPGETILIEAGSAFRLTGRFVHLRFIRGWMKPDILLADPLADLADRMGPQARQWCGMDIGLATSVEEFMRIEEAALTGGLAQRKGSGI